MNRLGMLQIPEQLTAAPAADATPLDRGILIHGSGAPPFPDGAHGGTVAAGQHPKSPVGQGQPSVAHDWDIGDQAQAYKTCDDLGES